MNNPEIDSVNHQYIKRREDFLFTIDHGNKVTSNCTCTAASDSASGAENIKLFVDGVIYNHSIHQLVEGFLSEGARYIEQVEGSFIIFLIDHSGFYILTDRVNSRKAFYAHINDRWYVSNNIDAMPKQKCSLSMDGLASFLAHGAMLNNLTIFREIKAAERASVHHFHDGELSKDTYWHYIFDYSQNGDIDESQLEEELRELLIGSVTRRYQTVSKAAQALTGGYDARCLLGILHNHLNAPDLFCFCYALIYGLTEEEDTAVAKRLADECGYSYQFIQSYKGNLLDVLQDSAVQGKCLCDFCSELDAWNTIDKQRPFTDLFTGDECFGMANTLLETKEDVLDSVYIKRGYGIGWLKSSIPSKLYRNLAGCLDQLADEIYEKTDALSDGNDKRDFLNLDQRISHMIMPWRENISDRVAFIHNPLLDDRVLEYNKKLPPSLRNYKKLFKRTVEKMFPDLFSIEMANLENYSADWDHELEKNKTQLISFVQTTESPLDSVISKEQIIAMINLHSSLKGKTIQKAKTFLSRSLNFFRRKSRTYDRLFNKLAGPGSKIPVPSSKLILRLLMIRIYLSQTQSKEPV